MRRLLLFVVLAATTAVPAAAQPPVNPTDVAVYDGQGDVLGTVLQLAGPEDSAVVALDVGGRAIFAYVRPSVIASAIASAPRVVYFTGAGCTGTPFVQRTDDSLTIPDPQAIVGPNFTIYAGPRTAGQTAVIVSTLGPGTACQPLPSITLDQLVPVSPLGELAPTFPPPYSLAPAPAPASPVPAVGPAGLALLAAGIALAAIVGLRRRRAGA